MTSTEHDRTWSERLDPRNWSLVAKLAVVGLVPTILALTIGAVRVIDQANVAEELGQGSGLVVVHQQIGALTSSLQAERSAAVTFVGGNRLTDRGAVDSAQAATDQAVQRTAEQLGAAEQQAPQLATARRQAETTLAQLPIIRSQVASGPTPALDVTTRYTSVVQRTLALDRALIGQLQTSETAGLGTAIGSGGDAVEALELERSVLNGAIAAKQIQEPQKALVNGAEAAYQSASSDFQASLTPQQVGQFGNFAQDPANNERQALRDGIMATANDGAVTADQAAWNAAVDRSSEVARNSTAQAENAFVAGRDSAAEEAGNTAGLNSVLLMLGLLLTVGIILLLGRQLVRSLRVLRTSALDVAERKLPQAVQGMRAGQAPNALVEPVPLDSRDEIGQVARAFDAVHGQAIRLAADQAALQQNVNSMFVNLSRRSQALVERQLQLIEQLESNEQDPDQLSNLFQLDHLATRMRRNSENLLVLAGTDLAKRNVAPVQVVDVLRAAVSEVEQYQRVIVQTPPTATVAGRAANDMVHLLAELLDNATNFSPPDSQVVMSTTRTADESLLIEISDRGVGMADSELADANQRLSGPSEVDVSASRRMGLFVVGRLAARHRVGVRLASTGGAGRSGGLTASVTIPPQLVPSAPSVPNRDDRAPALEQGGGGSGSWPMPPQTEERPRTAINGAGRNGPLRSMVAGTDGPMTPTFEATGGPSGPSRNGSAPKLPTRTPGSALRSNRPADESSTGPEASVNGSSPAGLRGAEAFRTAPESAEGPSTDGGDMFTPAVPDQGAGSSGGYPGAASPGQDDRTASAFTPGTAGPGDRGTADLTGGPTGDEARHDSGREAGTATAPTGSDGSDDAGSGQGPRNAMLGAAAFALGGAATAAATRGGQHDDRDADGAGDTGDAERASGGTADAGTTSGAAAESHDQHRGEQVTEQAGRDVESEGHTAHTPHATHDRDDADGDTDAGSADATTEGTSAAAALAEGGHTEDEPADTPAHGTQTADRTGTSGPEATRPEATRPETARPETARPETTQQDGADTGEEDPDTAALPVTPPRQPMGGMQRGPNGWPTGPNGQPSGRSGLPASQSQGQQSQGQPSGRPQGQDQSQGQGQGQGHDQGRPNGQPTRPGPTPARRPVMPGGPERRPDPAPAPAANLDADQDELFAPAVPVEGDRGQLRRPGGMETARAGGGYDISQTTPIFEEIASAWFRSNRSVPVRWQEGGLGDQGQAAPGPGPLGPSALDDGGPSAPASGGRPSPSPRAAQSAGSEAAGAPVDDAEFASPADEVWRQATTEGPESSDEMTSAGLPKRRPRARLLPGSAAGSTVLSPPAASGSRTAENVRGRLASYQQGVRQGRESAGGRTNRAGNGSPEPSGDRPNTSEHEENT